MSGNFLKTIKLWCRMPMDSLDEDKFSILCFVASIGVVVLYSSCHDATIQGTSSDDDALATNERTSHSQSHRNIKTLTIPKCALAGFRISSFHPGTHFQPSGTSIDSWYRMYQDAFKLEHEWLFRYCTYLCFHIMNVHILTPLIYQMFLCCCVCDVCVMFYM